MKDLHFDNRFVEQLPADPDTKNARRQVHNACYSLVNPTPVSSPQLVSYASEAAALIDLSESDCNSGEFLQIMAGNSIAGGSQPYAMCYGGHQFGNWAGQLGDGRAINLGEVTNKSAQHWTLQLKGAGETPYSRTADGLAVLRSSIREYICSEAMHHLGVPTTRALCLLTTGEQVMRDIMYDGHPAAEPGAIVCRMAPSFIRFGNFQIFAARDQLTELRQLADFTIRHYFPHLLEQHSVGEPEIYAAWFAEVCGSTVSMIVDWMRVGFVHGVMNTDNMSIHGLTIDYGPYGWLDNFDPEWTPNTTDAQHRRYRYNQQPNIALWNLYQLANSLYPLIEDTKPLETALEQMQVDYQHQWRLMMAGKLGLEQYQHGDEMIFEKLEKLLAVIETDMTIFYRLLSEKTITGVEDLLEAYYRPEQITDRYRSDMASWLHSYQARLSDDSRPHRERLQAMQKVNPKYIFRNYLAQQAIDKSEQGDHSMVNELLQLVRQPYVEQPGMQQYAAKRPDWARSKVGCSMLSCSS
ncbi:MAG: YdiU family protein [Arenicella sp.]|nr:YdiU family protein [Arenicella sp.]